MQFCNDAICTHVASLHCLALYRLYIIGDIQSPTTQLAREEVVGLIRKELSFKERSKEAKLERRSGSGRSS